MNISVDKSRVAIAEQAAAWFVTHRAAPLDERQRLQFFAWLKASPIHVEEYLSIAALESSLSAATEDPEISLDALLEAAHRDTPAQVVDLRSGRPASARPPEHTRRSNSWWVGAAALAGIGMVAAVLVWALGEGQWLSLPKTYQTTHGGQGMWQLADGSVLHLNTDSSVTVRFSEHERLVTLRQGQALFEVAHEAVRPFRVNSGDSSTVAVGTEFDVYRRGDATQITVVKGRVLVYPGPLSVSSSASMAGDEHSLSVSAGQQTTVRSGVMPTAPVNADLSRAVAWLERQIVFDQQPLDEVAGEFNRYNGISFEIDDPKLRTLPVSGVFDAYDPASFAAFLGSLDGIRVEWQGKLIRVTNAVAYHSQEKIHSH
jgi:transmembrane sensor